MKKLLIFLPIFVLTLVVFFYSNTKKIPVTQIASFKDCVQAGNPVMESNPRQCNADSRTFIEQAENGIDTNDLIHINTPQPNQTISSPVTIKGKARGNWFFEASFPVVITDWDGKIIGQGIAKAKSDWMTTEFVPFEATLTFTTDKNAYNNKGTLILRKDNPSGLPENDNSVEIPVILATASISTTTSSGIRGTISAGPTCQVQRIPSDPKCADRPVETNVSIYPAGNTLHAIAMLTSSASGTFEISLPRGEYIIMSGPYGVPFPRCPDTHITVGLTGYTKITISCDTGIR